MESEKPSKPSQLRRFPSAPLRPPSNYLRSASFSLEMLLKSRGSSNFSIPSKSFHFLERNAASESTSPVSSGSGNSANSAQDSTNLSSESVSPSNSTSSLSQSSDPVDSMNLSNSPEVELQLPPPLPSRDAKPKVISKTRRARKKSPRNLTPETAAIIVQKTWRMFKVKRVYEASSMYMMSLQISK